MGLSIKLDCTFNSLRTDASDTVLGDLLWAIDAALVPSPAIAKEIQTVRAALDPSGSGAYAALHVRIEDDWVGHCKKSVDKQACFTSFFFFFWVLYVLFIFHSFISSFICFFPFLKFLFNLFLVNIYIFAFNDVDTFFHPRWENIPDGILRDNCMVNTDQLANTLITNKVPENIPLYLAGGYTWNFVKSSPIFALLTKRYNVVMKDSC